MYASNTLDEHEENIRARYVGVCTSHYDLKVTINLYYIMEYICVSKIYNNMWSVTRI